MTVLGPYSGFILAAYATAALAVSGLLAWIIADHRALRRAIGDLEARGQRRRSARPEETP